MVPARHPPDPADRRGGADSRRSGLAACMLTALSLVLDLGGTIVFAVSGAVAAIKYRLDIFGVLVLSFAAGNAGGITRDVLFGAGPPAAGAGGGGAAGAI